MAFKIKSWFSMGTIDMVVALLVILSLVVGLANGISQHNFSRCLAAYETASQVSSQTRSDINSAQILLQVSEITALATLVEKVFVATTPQEAQADFIEYHKKNAVFMQLQKQLDEEKAAHPLPPPPKEVC